MLLLKGKRTVITSAQFEKFWGRGHLAGFPQFGAALKNGPEWIGKFILIRRKYALTLKVKLINAPNKNTKFFLQQISYFAI